MQYLLILKWFLFFSSAGVPVDWDEVPIRYDMSQYILLFTVMKVSMSKFAVPCQIPYLAKIFDPENKDRFCKPIALVALVDT